MLSDWLSENGRKAIEKMGWPEWAHETCGDDAALIAAVLATEGAGHED